MYNEGGFRFSRTPGMDTQYQALKAKHDPENHMTDTAFCLYLEAVAARGLDYWKRVFKLGGSSNAPVVSPSHNSPPQSPQHSGSSSESFYSLNTAELITEYKAQNVVLKEKLTQMKMQLKIEKTMPKFFEERTTAPPIPAPEI